MNPLSSVLGDLALLGSVAACALGGTVTLFALVTRRGRIARLAGFGTAGLVGLYALVLVGVAFASREVVLPPGSEKSISGFDPHLHFRVLDPASRGADGTVRVTLRARSDARRAVQDPREFRVLLIDSRGHAFAPLRAAGAARAPVFERRLHPGESCDVTLTFRPAPDSESLRLWVAEGAFPCAITIGHENSPFHRRTLLTLAGV